jgi:hypothetical protein
MKYKKLGVELNVKEIKLKELKQRRVFCDLQYTFLGEQHVAIIKKGNGSTMHPHPLCKPNIKFDIGPSFLKIAPCVVCLCGFPHNDIIVFLCRHLYHSWCVLVHFKQCVFVFIIPCFIIFKTCQPHDPKILPL